MRKVFAILFLYAISSLAQSTNFATRVTCEVQSAYPELRDLVWLQGTTPAVQAVPLNAGKPLSYDASTSVRMVIGPTATGTNFAVRTNAASVTNGYTIQWPTIGTNSSTNAWFYTLLFDRDGQTYWSGSGRLYIDATTSTASNGIDWIEYTIPSVSWENIVGDASNNASLVAYVESHSGGSAVDDVARTNAAEALAVGLAASNSASARLPLSGGTMTGPLIAGASSGGGSFALTVDNSASGGLGFEVVNSGGSQQYLARFGGSIMNILGVYGGRVGIGTTFPSNTFHVLGSSRFDGEVVIGGETRTNWPTGTGATYTVQGGTNVTVQTNGSAYVVSSSGAGGSIDTNAVKVLRDEPFRFYTSLDASSGTGTITTASTLWLSLDASDQPRTLAMGTGFSDAQAWRFYVKVGRGTNTFSVDTNLVGYSFLSLPVSSTNHLLIDRYPGDSSFRVLQVYR